MSNLACEAKTINEIKLKEKLLEPLMLSGAEMEALVTAGRGRAICE